MGQGLVDTMKGFQKVIKAPTSLLWGVKPLPTSLPNHFTELYSKDLFTLRMCSFTWLPWWAGACHCSVPFLQCLQISSNTDLTPHAGRGTTSSLLFLLPTNNFSHFSKYSSPLSFPFLYVFLKLLLFLESLVTWCILSRNLFLRF